MPYAINFYHDQLLADGGTSIPLPPIHRIVYIRLGEVIINGETYGPDTAIYSNKPLTITGSADHSQLARWEITSPNGTSNLLEGTNVLSKLRMSRVNMMHDMLPGSQWLFRLDRITVPPGRVSDRHQHPGPGIRCLLEGTFNVQQPPKSVRTVMPGDPWWESGYDTVVAWASQTMHARFLRGMILPVEFKGRPDTAIWLSGDEKKPRGNWHYYVDEIIEV